MKPSSVRRIVFGAAALLLGYNAYVIAWGVHQVNPLAAKLGFALFVTWASIILKAVWRGHRESPEQFAALHSQVAVDRAARAAALSAEAAALDAVDVCLCVMSMTKALGPDSVGGIEWKLDPADAAAELALRGASPGSPVVFQRAAALTRTGRGTDDPGELAPRVWASQLVAVGVEHADASLVRRALDRARTIGGAS